MNTRSGAHVRRPFDFGLSEDDERRAARLHSESIVIDLLSQHAGSNIFNAYPRELQADLHERLSRMEPDFDGLLEAIYWPYEMAKKGRSHLIRDWYVESGLTCGTYGIEVHGAHDPQPVRWETRVFRYADLPWMRYVTTANEIRQAKRDGVIAFYGHCQPVTPPPRNLAAFDAAYSKGLRSFMLTYNLMDTIGVGCTERVDAGLSRFGLDVVHYCNAIGMIVDVSHCGFSTTLDGCRHSKRPVNANHTAARGMHDHARGKSDEELKSIAATGGVIGIVAVPAFLTPSPRPTINHLLDHMDYIARLVGWQHVAIGTDWPLQAPEWLQEALLAPGSGSVGYRKEDRLDVTVRLEGFDDCRDLPNITRGLVARGYSDEQVRGILGENALRVFAAVCG